MMKLVAINCTSTAVLTQTPREGFFHVYLSLVASNPVNMKGRKIGAQHATAHSH